LLTRLAIACALLLVACTSTNRGIATSSPAAPATTVGSSTSGAPSSPAAPATGSSTVWLCRPGLANNPCESDLSSTTVTATGARTAERAQPAADPPIDCFYVYPTVSTQPALNADLHIDPEETAVATAQAARFSTVCRVFAPMYPQLTKSALAGGASSGTVTAAIKAYAGVLDAWRDYLAHDNHGRGVVLIGHSQGAFLLTALLTREIDPVAALRKKLVSALLLGGNVTVPKGKGVGGAFTKIPACTSGTEVGCVVAYSTFDSQPPANSLFGRAGTGIGANFGGTSQAGMQVLCTNPATLDGSGGRLRPYFPTAPFPGLGSGQSTRGVTTPWVSFPGEYTGSCRDRGGASWLQVTATTSASDPRPVVQDSLGPTWGLHLVDVNIALGNLVALVAKQSRAYAG
jgi:hypothetical protein